MQKYREKNRIGQYSLQKKETIPNISKNLINRLEDLFAKGFFDSLKCNMHFS
jgi:hypothetical protein